MNDPKKIEIEKIDICKFLVASGYRLIGLKEAENLQKRIIENLSESIKLDTGDVLEGEKERVIFINLMGIRSFGTDETKKGLTDPLMKIKLESEKIFQINGKKLHIAFIGVSSQNTRSLIYAWNDSYKDWCDNYKNEHAKRYPVVGYIPPIHPSPLPPIVIFDENLDEHHDGIAESKDEALLIYRLLSQNGYSLKNEMNNFVNKICEIKMEEIIKFKDAKYDIHVKLPTGMHITPCIHVHNLLVGGAICETIYEMIADKFKDREKEITKVIGISRKDYLSPLMAEAVAKNLNISNWAHFKYHELDNTWKVGYDRDKFEGERILLIGDSMLTGNTLNIAAEKIIKEKNGQIVDIGVIIDSSGGKTSINIDNKQIYPKALKRYEAEVCYPDKCQKLGSPIVDYKELSGIPFKHFLEKGL